MKKGNEGVGEPASHLQGAGKTAYVIMARASAELEECWR